MGIQTASRARLAVAAMCACANVHAAGGHFAVDDATLLDPGEWEQETWFGRGASGASIAHAGLNFRVGPVEFDGAVEHARSGEPSARTWNLELKWARALGERLSVGLDLQPAWTTLPSSLYAVTRFNAIATWKLQDTLFVNVNAGHDWVRGAADLPRGGASLEWTPLAPLTLVAERYLETGTHFFRAGARWSPSPRWTWDFSGAHRLAGPAPSTWTLGLTFHGTGP